MSVLDKIGSIMARPNEDLVEKDNISKWWKYGVRAFGSAAGGIAIFLGIWAAIGIVFADVGCLFGGIWQMLAGFVLITIEAPCCCMFLDFVTTFSEFAENRPFWNRGAFYIIIALPAFFLCLEASVIIGSGMIFATGVLYGMMAIGKKASREEMQSNIGAESSSIGGSRNFQSPLAQNPAPMGTSVPVHQKRFEV